MHHCKSLLTYFFYETHIKTHIYGNVKIYILNRALYFCVRVKIHVED